MSITIKKQSSVDVSVYVTLPTGESQSESETEYVFPAGSTGYVVFTKENKFVAAEKVGNVKDVSRFSGKRKIAFESKVKSGVTLNGVTQEGEGFLWFAPGENKYTNPECFVENNEGSITIDMARDGVYCVNNEVLCVIDGVKIRDPIQFTEKKGVRYIKVKTDEITNIHHDGLVEYEGNMFKYATTNSGASRVVFHPANYFKELFYIEFKDGSFADIVFSEINPGPVYFQKSFKGVYNFLAGYRCKALHMPTVEAPKDEVTSVTSVDVTRYDGSSPTLKFECQWLTTQEYSINNIFLSSFHSNQKITFNYGDVKTVESLELIKEVDGVASLEPVEGLVVEVNQWYTQLRCKFKDGTYGRSKIWRELIKTTEEKKGVQRFATGATIGPLKSDQVYMIDDTVYEKDSTAEFHDATFNRRELIIKPKIGITRVGTFSIRDLAWTFTEFRHDAIFDEVYTYNVSTLSKVEVKMSLFGMYDPKDDFKFFDGSSQLNKNRFKLKASDSDTSAGTLLVSKTFTAVLEGETEEKTQKWTFKVDFVFEPYNRVSFLHHDDDDFSEPLFRRVSFSGSKKIDPFWTYGPLVGKNGQKLHAFGNEVVNGCVKSNIFPIITFNELTCGSINVTEGSYQIYTEVLRDDMEIKLEQSDEYLRLNSCSNVKFEGNTIRVPANAGLCFFLAGQKLYLLRSASIRSASFERRSSFVGSPRSGAASPLEESLSATTDKVNEVIDEAVETVAEVPKKIVEAVNDVVDAISGAADAVGDAVKDAAEEVKESAASSSETSESIKIDINVNQEPPRRVIQGNTPSRQQSSSSSNQIKRSIPVPINRTNKRTVTPAAQPAPRPAPTPVRTQEPKTVWKRSRTSVAPTVIAISLDLFA